MNPTTQAQYDLIVIGGGSGGLAAALRAAEHGARVALCEPNALGGTCVNAGCVPKKAMWLAADLSARVDMARSLGFDLPPVAVDWPTFLVHRQRYIHNIHASYRQSLDAAGIALLTSRARLRDAHTVVCTNGIAVRGERLLIATGARPKRPDVQGAQLGGVSDDFFHWTASPPRVAIIGAGYIAVELAGMLQLLGSRVDVFARGQRLLPGFDAELAAQLAEEYRQSGVHLHVGYGLGRVERDTDGEGLRLIDMAGGVSERFNALLFATGRRANTDDLGLESVGVVMDAQGRIVVNAANATNVDSVYAVGDVTTDPALTPVAIAAARRLMDRLYAGATALLDRHDIPTVVFSYPPLAGVGLTEEDARTRCGDAVQTYRAGFRPMLHALADSPQRSLFKLVCVGEARRVVGIHLLGQGADEILQGFAVALKRGITLDDLRDTMAIHPTSAEEVVLMR